MGEDWSEAAVLACQAATAASLVPLQGIDLVYGAVRCANTVFDLTGSTSSQAKLFRDIFGNPFRPVSFNPAWRTDTAVAVARQMYDSREFGAMPILADALQDAGCEDEQVLTHCREPGPHVRGCWVCDLVLGFA